MTVQAGIKLHRGAEIRIQKKPTTTKTQQTENTYTLKILKHQLALQRDSLR